MANHQILLISASLEPNQYPINYAVIVNSTITLATGFTPNLPYKSLSKFREKNQ